MKCQSFDSHYAKNCKNSHNTCGTCAGDHHTKGCTNTSPDKCYCANCKETGHATWDCKCPTFINLSKCYHSHLPDIAYRFFPESDNPATWVQEDQVDQAWEEPPQDENGRPHPQPHPMFMGEPEWKKVDHCWWPPCPSQEPHHKSATSNPPIQTLITDKWPASSQNISQAPLNAQTVSTSNNDSPSPNPNS